MTSTNVSQILGRGASVEEPVTYRLPRLLVNPALFGPIYRIGSTDQYYLDKHISFYFFCTFFSDRGI